MIIIIIIIKQIWHLFGVFGSLKHIILGHNTSKKFDRDSNLKICLLPGLEAQKVENP
jgi:hypothetical protein